MFNPDDMPDAIPAEWLAHANLALAASQTEFHQLKKIFNRPQVIRKLRELYHGSLRFPGVQITRIIALIGDLGLAENTLVVFTTGHGDML